MIFRRRRLQTSTSSMVPLLDSPMYGALLVAVTYLKFSLRPADESLAQKSSPPAAVAGELNAGGFQGGFGGGAGEDLLSVEDTQKA